MDRCSDIQRAAVNAGTASTGASPGGRPSLPATAALVAQQHADEDFFSELHLQPPLLPPLVHGVSNQSRRRAAESVALDDELTRLGVLQSRTRTQTGNGHEHCAAPATASDSGAPSGASSSTDRPAPQLADNVRPARDVKCVLEQLNAGRCRPLRHNLGPRGKFLSRGDSSGDDAGVPSPARVVWSDDDDGSDVVFDDKGRPSMLRDFGPVVTATSVRTMNAGDSMRHLELETSPRRQLKQGASTTRSARKSAKESQVHSHLARHPDRLRISLARSPASPLPVRGRGSVSPRLAGAKRIPGTSALVAEAFAAKDELDLPATVNVAGGDSGSSWGSGSFASRPVLPLGDSDDDYNSESAAAPSSASSPPCCSSPALVLMRCSSSIRQLGRSSAAAPPDLWAHQRPHQREAPAGASGGASLARRIGSALPRMTPLDVVEPPLEGSNPLARIFAQLQEERCGQSATAEAPVGKARADRDSPADFVKSVGDLGGLSNDSIAVHGMRLSRKLAPEPEEVCASVGAGPSAARVEQSAEQAASSGIGERQHKTGAVYHPNARPVSPVLLSPTTPRLGAAKAVRFGLHDSDTTGALTRPDGGFESVHAVMTTPRRPRQQPQQRQHDAVAPSGQGRVVNDHDDGGLSRNSRGDEHSDDDDSAGLPTALPQHAAELATSRIARDLHSRVNACNARLRRVPRVLRWLCVPFIFGDSIRDAERVRLLLFLLLALHTIALFMSEFRRVNFCCAPFDSEPIRMGLFTIIVPYPEGRSNSYPASRINFLNPPDAFHNFRRERNVAAIEPNIGVDWELDHMGAVASSTVMPLVLLAIAELCLVVFAICFFIWRTQLGFLLAALIITTNGLGVMTYVTSIHGVLNKRDGVLGAEQHGNPRLGPSLFLLLPATPVAFLLCVTWLVKAAVARRFYTVGVSQAAREYWQGHRMLRDTRSGPYSLRAGGVLAHTLPMFIALSPHALPRADEDAVEEEEEEIEGDVVGSAGRGPSAGHSGDEQLQELAVPSLAPSIE